MLATMKTSYPSRRLHLVDVENLLGCPRPAAVEVLACRQRYADLAQPTGWDQCVVACNHGAGAEVGFSWPGVRLLWRSGPDGADLALRDVLTHENVADRFKDVILASGDGLFADPVSELARAGVHVTVVANRRSLARRLELAAAAVIYFDAELPPALSGACRLRAVA
jgi:hypothetical protein